MATVGVLEKEITDAIVEQSPLETVDTDDMFTVSPSNISMVNFENTITDTNDTAVEKCKRKTRLDLRLDMSGRVKRPNANRPKTRLYMCPDCNLEMVFSNIDGRGCYFCEDCGAIEEVIGDNSESVDGGQHTSNAVSSSYNTCSTSTVPLKIVGPNAGMYQRRVTSSTANYKNTQRIVTYQDMTRYATQYQGAEVPPHLIKLAADEFCRLQEYFIKRGDVRLGTMAWLVYEACRENNIDRSSKEIADMYEIQQSELSRGSKLVKEARAAGLLEPEKKQGYILELDMHAKMERYFAVLDIPTDDGAATGHPNYWGFVEKLILFTHARRKKSWHSGMKARCTGAIYILGQQVPELGLTKKAISEKCEISAPTFLRFSGIINDILQLPESNKTRRMLVHIYKTHDISF